MPQDEETRENKGLEIYRRLSNTWKMAGLDREIGFKELVLAPIYDGFAPIGAAIFLSVLCCPEDREKRSRLVDAISAHVIKASAKPKSRKRRDLRAIPGIARLIDLPNRRIEQTLKEGLRRLQGACHPSACGGGCVNFVQNSVQPFGSFTPRPCSVHRGDCINFEWIDHLHLGHCAKGEPESITGLWDTDRRYCECFLPRPQQTHSDQTRPARAKTKR